MFKNSKEELNVIKRFIELENHLTIFNLLHEIHKK
jgi:hypothetical protein